MERVWDCDGTGSPGVQENPKVGLTHGSNPMQV